MKCLVDISCFFRIQVGKEFGIKRIEICFYNRRRSEFIVRYKGNCG